MDRWIERWIERWIDRQILFFLPEVGLNHRSNYSLIVQSGYQIGSIHLISSHYIYIYIHKLKIFKKIKYHFLNVRIAGVYYFKNYGGWFLMNWKKKTKGKFFHLCRYFPPTFYFLLPPTQRKILNSGRIFFYRKFRTLLSCLPGEAGWRDGGDKVPAEVKWGHSLQQGEVDAAA